jgi:hypothetical protein
MGTIRVSQQPMPLCSGLAVALSFCGMAAQFQTLLTSSSIRLCFYATMVCSKLEGRVARVVQGQSFDTTHQELLAVSESTIYCGRAQTGSIPINEHPVRLADGCCARRSITIVSALPKVVV